MKHKFLLLITSCILIFGGYISYRINTGRLYDTYSNLWVYRILHPELLPNTDMVKITSAGHTTTYADIMWINLIQYIADNLRDSSYYNFLNQMIEKIVELHPKFTRAYEISLLLAPSLKNESSDYEKRKRVTQYAEKIGELGIRNTCNPETLKLIQKEGFSKELWENPKLKNPCISGQIPYQLAIVKTDLGKYNEAKEYYKIASVQTDAPSASRFLGPLMDSKQGDHKNAGETFLLIATEGYDESPYTCQKIALSLLKNYKESADFSSYIWGLRKIEDELVAPKETDNPLASSSSNCYNSVLRAMKQFYLGYITEMAEKNPEYTTGEELIKNRIVPKIPSIHAQDGWKIQKKNNSWSYYDY